MPLTDLTPEAVRQAIAEFDRLGRDSFLNTYEFGKARGYSSSFIMVRHMTARPSPA